MEMVLGLNGLSGDEMFLQMSTPLHIHLFKQLLMIIKCISCTRFLNRIFGLKFAQYRPPTSASHCDIAVPLVTLHDT